MIEISKIANTIEMNIDKDKETFVIIHKPTGQIVRVSKSAREVFSGYLYASQAINLARTKYVNDVEFLEKETHLNKLKLDRGIPFGGKEILMAQLADLEVKREAVAILDECEIKTLKEKGDIYE